MKVLLDECFPDELAPEFVGVDVSTVEQNGWLSTKNGDLLRLAEGSYDVFVSIDQGIPFQQNYRRYAMAFIIVRVPNNSVETIRTLIGDIISSLPTAKVGEICWIPEPPKNWPTE